MKAVWTGMMVIGFSMASGINFTNGVWIPAVCFLGMAIGCFGEFAVKDKEK